MAGIYIHIPFCRQACHYCDFHFSTNLSKQDEMVDAIILELKEREDYLEEPVKTIYFGGGTPSLLKEVQLKKIMASLQDHYEIDNEAEITLEANPEDLTLDQANSIFDNGINRLSIGIQTFNSEKLNWMNRAHNSNQSISAYENARKVGFKNISLDLIYAIPDHNRKEWETDLATLSDLEPEHISLYGLTIEDKTVFGKWEREQKLIEVPEDEAAKQYLFAIDFLTSNGFIQYEVSNFGKAGFSSRHNNAYWNGVPYLGVGPGAHSFNSTSRRFNMRNNAQYLRALHKNEPYSETETLSKVQLVNEKILTQLRTNQGLLIEEIDQGLLINFMAHHDALIREMVSQNLVEIDNKHIRLKPHGFLVADEIALRLFFPE
ncbi:radical SAM family heme chaperone HemW [Ekhidna sp.]